MGSTYSRNEIRATHVYHIEPHLLVSKKNTNLRAPARKFVFPIPKKDLVSTSHDNNQWSTIQQTGAKQCHHITFQRIKPGREVQLTPS